MICQHTPKLDDVELMMALDGEADPEVAMHMSHCPLCGQRAAQLAGAEQIALKNLYRAACPGTLELGEYHLGLAPAGAADSIRQHLAQCPYCRAELAQLSTFMRQPDPHLYAAPPASARQRLQVLVARLTSGLGAQPAFAPALAGLRGAVSGPLTFEAGDAQIVLEVQDDEQRAGRKTIIGLVMGLSDQALHAHVWRDDELAATVPVDAVGNFVVDDLAPGACELIVAGELQEIHVQDLKL